jgi:hypothetical protein
MYKYATANVAKAQAQEQRKETLKVAATETGSTGSTTSKRWKRSEIQKLMQTDNATYQKHRLEIAKAYQDGQVINDID